jgi:hypothetical protein
LACLGLQVAELAGRRRPRCRDEWEDRAREHGGQSQEGPMSPPERPSAPL